MVKIIINECEYEVSDSLVQRLQEEADELGVPVEELASELLEKAVEESPEIAKLVAEIEAEASRRGITVDHYIAEAENAAQMTALLIRLLKAKR